MDAYEWKQNGSLHLLSTGRSGADDSSFGNASPSGDDAFFLTRDRLVSSDQDDAVDMYDARVNGGFPGEPAPCEGAECKSETSGPPDDEAGSSNLAGPGNAEPAAEDCSKLERKAKKKKRALRTTKRKLRRARKADNDNRVKRLKKQKNRKAKKARRANKEAKQCKREAGE
jgi:hypothetical protein